MKKFQNLNSIWKELLFAFSGFGPNLLMILMGAFYTDAINPAALSESAKYIQSINGTCLILPAVFPILWFLSKAFDGIIDIPFASITDTIKTKWGRRRIPIFVAFIPMVLGYTMCWIPIGNEIANTIWFTVWALIFFAAYTMCLISFYGSLSTVCYNEKQRLRVSSFKSFFDTITYILVYALVPLILGLTKMNIQQLVFILIPTMLTMTIPLFMIKEGVKWEQKAISEGYDITPLADEPRVGIWESIKKTFTCKPFLRWCIVNCCSFFGLQMFLVSMNALIVGGMGLDSTQMAILNTAAFAPVPVTLYLFTKLKEKKGIRFAYQTCLISFAVCILTFIAGNTYFAGDNTAFKMVIGIIGGIVGSWSIGSFFMMPYLIPAQISSVEEKLTKKNHSAMYFAAQAVTTSIIGAAASSLVYENIKMLFITKDWQVTYAKTAEDALNALGASEVFNLGTLLVPIFVSVFCIIGFIVAFGMPKNYTPKEVAKQLGLEKEYEANKDLFDEKTEYPFEGESLIVNISLWVLSGTIFGYIWNFSIAKCINTFGGKKIKLIHLILAILIPFYSIYLVILFNKAIKEKSEQLGIKFTSFLPLHIICNALFLNVISLSVLQHQLNKVAKTQNAQIDLELQGATN